MKIREGFVLREIAGQVVVVPTGKLVDEFNGMIHLNGTGRFIWELLQEDREFEQVVNQLASQYKIDLEQARRSVQNFIEQLKNANVMEE